MRTLRIATGLTVLLLMSGCAAEVTTSVAAPSPTAPSSNEPTSEPTFDSNATTAVIFGTRVEFRNAAGEIVDRIGFDAEPAEFISKISEHLGPADEESHDDRGCSAQIYNDGLVVPYWSDGSYTAELIVIGSVVNGIRVETPSGVSVGEDGTALVDSVAPELKFDFHGGERSWSFVYDVAGWWGLDTEEAKQYGAKAWVDDGVLSRIMVPGHVGTMHTSC